MNALTEGVSRTRRPDQRVDAISRERAIGGELVFSEEIRFDNASLIPAIIRDEGSDRRFAKFFTEEYWFEVHWLKNHFALFIFSGTIGAGANRHGSHSRRRYGS